MVASAAVRRPLDPPRVSLVLLSYQYERYIGETIASVLAQSCPDWELVVVDDGSTDGSLEVIRGFADPRISLHPARQRLGASRSYNRGLALCRGDYVGSVDADDLLDPRRLEVQVAFMDAHPELDATGTYVAMIDAEGAPTAAEAERWVNQPRDLTRLESWTFLDPLCHSSVLLRRRSHRRVGGLDPDLHLAPDFDLWARCLGLGMRFAVIPEQLTRYRVHAANVSATHAPAELFVELAFIFCKRLAPLLVRRGRGDLLARCLRYFDSLLADASLEIRLETHRLLSAFAAYPAAIEPFRQALGMAGGERWPRILAAATRRRGSARAVPSATAKELGPAPPPAPPAASSPALAVVDDFFPDLLTSFRIEELNQYLVELDCEVHSTHLELDRALASYRQLYPELAGRVRALDRERLSGSTLLYFVFLANARRHLRLVEDLGIPFVFTLYPGAGFGMNDAVSDHQLQEVCRSPLLRRVLVTQEVTREYLLQSGRCPPEKIVLVYGAPLPAARYRAESPPRHRYPEGKSTFDVCFVALRYMRHGVDKGYPTFVAVARALAAVADDVRFHVVGGMEAADLPVDDLGDRLRFYGPRPTSFFPAFYAGMDVILSPNRPFVLRPGSFDGFPTASCVEASLAGVAMMVSDELGENRRGGWYRPDEELVIVEPRAADIVPRLLEARREPGALYRLAAAGQARSHELFGPARQMAPRLALLRELLAAEARATRRAPGVAA